MSEEQFNEAQEGRRRLLTHLTGILVCEDGAEPVRFLIADRGDRLVLPMPVDLAECDQWSLAAPTELEPAIEFSLESTEPDGYTLREPTLDEADRWMAYHGQIPPKSSLVVLSSGFARYRDDNGQTRVIDDPLTPNPIRRYVPVLCKALRGNELELSDACARLTGVRPESPAIVGIDEWGVHVRAAFDVLRLEFREPATDHDSAWRKAWELLDG